MSAAEEQLLAPAPERWRSRVDARELLAEALLAAGFAAASAALIVGLGDGAAPAAGPAIALALTVAVLSRIEFHAGSGYTVPTQLALVPALFVVPAVWAPVVIAGGLTVGLLPAIRSRRRHVSRVLTGPANAWFALGPALVFALADPGAPSLGDWPVYALAIGAQFLTDYLYGAAGEWISLGVRPGLQLRLMGPVWLVDVLLSPIGLLAAIASTQQRYAFVLALPLGALLSVFARERRARIDQAIELSRAYRNTALLLCDVISSDDAYTGAHSRDVVMLSVAIAQRLGMDEDDQRLVEMGALLHDVGKIAIPNEIINKPGPLEDAEWEIVRNHTVVGQQMLDKVGGFLSEVGAVVRSSHERFDGNGYPDGIAGPAIPLASRVVSVADAYNAMTTTRPYRRQLPHSAAIDELRAHAGRQFDPDAVDALVAVLAAARRPVRMRAPALRARPAVGSLMR